MNVEHVGAYLGGLLCQQLFLSSSVAEYIYDTYIFTCSLQIHGVLARMQYSQTFVFMKTLMHTGGMATSQGQEPLAGKHPEYKSR